MELNIITESDLSGKGVIGQPDVPGLTALEMQEKIEEIVRSVAIEKINEIIQYLNEYGATREDLEDIVINAGAVTSVHGRRGNVVAQSGDYSYSQVGAAAASHASQHRANGSDPITPAAIGAAAAEHSHGSITKDGKIGTVNGKILMTGIGGVIETAEKENLGFVEKPETKGTSGAVTVTLEDNVEYEYTGVTSLRMTGANVSCHGMVTFGSNAPSVSLYGFKSIGGDDIVSDKAPGETWEFSCFGNRILWKNWG